MGFAVRHTDLIKRLVLMNTWAFARWPGGELPRLIEIIRSHKGESFVLEKNGYPERALLGTSMNQAAYDPPVLDAYLAPFPTPESRLALLCWSRDITTGPGDPSYSELKRIEEALPKFVEIPVLLLWGMLDPVLPPDVLRKWITVYPHAWVREIDNASHFLQEDAPEKVLEELEKFLEET